MSFTALSKNWPRRKQHDTSEEGDQAAGRKSVKQALGNHSVHTAEKKII